MVATGCAGLLRSHTFTVLSTDPVAMSDPAWYLFQSQDRISRGCAGMTMAERASLRSQMRSVQSPEAEAKMSA